MGNTTSHGRRYGNEVKQQAVLLSCVTGLRYDAWHLISAYRSRRLCDGSMTTSAAQVRPVH
jgi:hypothetical protein